MWFEWKVFNFPQEAILRKSWKQIWINQSGEKDFQEEETAWNKSLEKVNHLSFIKEQKFQGCLAGSVS